MVSLYGQALPGCPGSSSAPAAEPGHLCVYLGHYEDIALGPELKGPDGGSDFRAGAALFLPIAAACGGCQAEVLGTWA